MEGATALIWTLVVVVVIFIVLGVFYYIVQPSVVVVNPQEYTQPYLGLSYWSPVIKNDVEPRGNCQLYTFPAAVDTSNPCVNGTCPMIPGMPSNNKSIVDNLQPQAMSGCYDPDQLASFQGTRVCIQQEASAFPSGCVNYQGVKVTPGTRDIVYSHSGYTKDKTTIVCNARPCTGRLSVFAVNYLTNNNNAAANGIRCLVAQPDNSVTLTNCSIADQQQLVRVELSSVSSSPSNSGQYASLYFRSAQGYLNVSSDGRPVIGNNSGKIWLLVNQQLSSTRFAPQQTLDISNLTTEQVENLFGDTPDDTINLLTASGIRSLQMSGSQLVLAPYASTNLGNQLQSATTQYIDYNLFNQIVFGLVPYTFSS